MKNGKYETLLIARPDLEKEQIKELVKRLKERIERREGKLFQVDDWGLRKLAYPIRSRGEKFYYGNYLLLSYLGNGGTVKELEDYLKLIDETFRFQTEQVGRGEITALLPRNEEGEEMELKEPIWREVVVPEIKLREDGEGLEVVEPSRDRKLSREQLYRSRITEKPSKEKIEEAGEGAELKEASVKPSSEDKEAVAKPGASSESANQEGEEKDGE